MPVFVSVAFPFPFVTRSTLFMDCVDSLVNITLYSSTDPALTVTALPARVMDAVAPVAVVSGTVNWPSVNIGISTVCLFPSLSSYVTVTLRIFIPASGIRLTVRPSTVAEPPLPMLTLALEISDGLIVDGAVCWLFAPCVFPAAPALRFGFAFPLESSEADAVVFSIWLPSAAILRSPFTVTNFVLLADVPASVAAVVPLMTAIATEPATAAWAPPAPATASVVNVCESGSVSTLSLTSRIPVRASMASLVRALPASLSAVMRFCLNVWATCPDFMKLTSCVTSQRPSVRTPATFLAMSEIDLVTASLQP